MSDTLLRTVRVLLERLANALRQPGAPDSGDARLAPKVAAPEYPSLSVSLSVSGQDEPIVMSLTPGQQIILGRADESVDTELLVDLTPYNAHELGVSRKHAALNIEAYLDVVQVMDVGSTNGTYLNGQRLIPHAPRTLREGDEIRLGFLRVRVQHNWIFLFERRIRLYNPSSRALWETNGTTWDAALELAMLYGWQPFLGENAHRAHVTKVDARALADALERSLPDLADEPPKAVAKQLGSPRIEPSAWYFGGQAGKQKVCDLIAFCHQGAFRIEVC